MENARLIADALAQAGFSRSMGHADAHVFEGNVAIGGQSYALEIRITDPHLLSYPEIRIRDGRPAGTVTPHIIGDGKLCYAEAGSIVLDPANPGGSILRLLEQAKVTLSYLHGGDLAEVRREFIAYWAQIPFFVDLPQQYEGPTKVFRIEQKDIVRFVVSNRAATYWSNFFGVSSDQVLEHRSCFVFSTSQHTPLGTGGPFPAVMHEGVEWLAGGGVDVKNHRKFRSWLDGDHSFPPALLLNTKDGVFGFDIQLPGTAGKKAALYNVGKTLMKAGCAFPIVRIGGISIDVEGILTRNLLSNTSLIDRRILLVGCGTIGSHLAKMLCQVGAGAGDKGLLTLVDPDHLSAGNLGRHLLSPKYLAWNKARACCEHLKATFCWANFSFRSRSIALSASELGEYDLIVDTTGEEAVSNWLNLEIVRRRQAGIPAPAILYAWLYGNGVAAQAFLSVDDKMSCFRCLRPDFGGKWRYPPVDENEEVQIVVGRCGDASFVPFPVSSSVQAAALALDSAIGWISRPRTTLNTQPIVTEQSRHRKTVFPERNHRCPVCMVT